jgi:hypothetical protein
MIEHSQSTLSRELAFLESSTLELREGMVASGAEEHANVLANPSHLLELHVSRIALAVGSAI